MAELASGGDIAGIDEIDRDEASRIGNYLASHGGPFFELQRRLGLLREDALLAGRRAAMFVALAWGVPFLLSLIHGDAFTLTGGRPFVLDFGAWARFFIAIALFVLAEQQVEYGLHGKLGQLARATIIAPGSFEAAANAVVRALRLRDSKVAEIALSGPRDRRDPGAPRQSHDRRQLDLGGRGRQRRRACDAGWMVERGLQHAAFLLPAVPRPLALYCLGDVALADRGARAPAGRDPSRWQGRFGLSRRLSERLFDVRLRDELGAGDHSRQARVRGQHFLGHFWLHHHRVAGDRVCLFRLSIAGVLEASRRTEEQIGRNLRRAGDALSSRG